MSYSLIILDENKKLSWTYPFTGGVIVSDINDVNPTMDGFTLTLPPANVVPVGTSILVNNVGIYDFTILKNDGSPLTNLIITEEVNQIYLINSDTAAGIWRVIPFGGGFLPITAISTISSNNSVNITPGTITPPGGTFDFTLSDTLENINLLASTGFLARTDSTTWKTRALLSGNNISVSNGDGVLNNPTINLSSTVSGLSSIGVGNLTLTGSSLSSSGDLNITTTGTNNISLNGLQIDSSGKISSPTVARAQCFFYDTNATSDNVIIQNSFNIASITGGQGSYVVTFSTPFQDGNYSVFLTLAHDANTLLPFAAFFTSRQSGSVQIFTIDTLGNLLPVSAGISVVIFAN
jgi:hypothetical protein